MSKITTAQMREWHVRHDHTGTKPRKYYEAEFDGWLAQVRSEARRDALREAAEDIRPKMRVEMDPSTDKDPAASLATANAILHGTADRLRALADRETL